MKKVVNFLVESNEYFKESIMNNKKENNTMKYIIHYGEETLCGDINQIDYENRLVTLDDDNVNNKSLLLLAVTNYVNGSGHYAVLDFVAN